MSTYPRTRIDNVLFKVLILLASFALTACLGSDDDDDDKPSNPQPSQDALTTQPVQINPVPTSGYSGPGMVDTGQPINLTISVADSELPQGTSSVLINWSLGDGTSGNQQVAVSGGGATHTVTHAYHSVGVYAMTVSIEIVGLPGFSLSGVSLIEVGMDLVERVEVLNVCDIWYAAQSGGQGGSVDRWDISDIPDGAEFDIRFDAYSIPDKYIVDYRGVVELDTGWRGASSYDGDPLYPGGIAGPGAGEETGIFTKQGVNDFRTVVVAPQSGTAWNYEIRCRTGSSGSGGSSNALVSGVPVTGISLQTNDWVEFYIDVPQGASGLTVTTSGSNGDADLYVEGPNGASCDSASWDSNEICTFSSPAAGRWLIEVDAYEAFTNLTLTATVQ